MNKKFPLLYLEWIDSSSGNSGWQDAGSFKETDYTFFCKSIGWLVNETDRFLVIVPHLAGDKVKEGFSFMQGCGDMAIPKVSIIKKRVIKYE